METQRSGHRRFLMKVAWPQPRRRGLAAGCTTTEPAQGSIVE